MIDYAVIGKRIQKKRQERSITQEKLAEQVGISYICIQVKENSLDGFTAEDAIVY